MDIFCTKHLEVISEVISGEFVDECLGKYLKKNSPKSSKGKISAETLKVIPWKNTKKKKIPGWTFREAVGGVLEKSVEEFLIESPNKCLQKSQQTLQKGTMGIFLEIFQ